MCGRADILDTQELACEASSVSRDSSAHRQPCVQAACVPTCPHRTSPTGARRWPLSQSDRVCFALGQPSRHVEAPDSATPSSCTRAAVRPRELQHLSMRVTRLATQPFSICILADFTMKRLGLHPDSSLICRGWGVWWGCLWSSMGRRLSLADASHHPFCLSKDSQLWRPRTTRCRHFPA